MKLILPSGLTGFWNERNEWQVTGSQMGRRNVLPEDEDTEPGKWSLRRLGLTDGGCYDSGGAYWGSPQTMWIAFTAHKVYSPVRGAFELIPVYMIFVRANDRGAAKQAVWKILPGATFHR